MMRIHMSVSSISGRIYTVKEVDSSVNCLNNICWGSYTHKVSWFIFRQIWNNFIKDIVHLIMCLSYCKSANCITI